MWLASVPVSSDLEQPRPTLSAALHKGHVSFYRQSPVCEHLFYTFSIFIIIRVFVITLFWWVYVILFDFIIYIVGVITNEYSYSILTVFVILTHTKWFNFGKHMKTVQNNWQVVVIFSVAVVLYFILCVVVNFTSCFIRNRDLSIFMKVYLKTNLMKKFISFRYSTITWFQVCYLICYSLTFSKTIYAPIHYKILCVEYRYYFLIKSCLNIYIYWYNTRYEIGIPSHLDMHVWRRESGCSNGCLCPPIN